MGDDLIRRCGGTFPRGEGEGRARLQHEIFRLTFAC